MYEFSSLKRVLEDPRRIPRVYHFFACKFDRWYHRRFRDGGGVDVMAEDWDTLVILDACRYDAFAEQCDLDGRLEKRTSRGSHSLEFMEENFAGRELHDTVYVTANPMLRKFDEEGVFHAVQQLDFSGWDDDLGTVPPDTMVEATLAARERYPEKRVISHFLQPHVPFIGETGREMEYGGPARFEESGEVVREDDAHVWFKARFLLDGITTEKVRRAYRENLAIVLDAVGDLLEDLREKTVLTADHGELLGDWIGPLPAQEFSHPRGVRAPELVEVPWFVVDGERVDVTADPPKSKDSAEVDAETVEDRLRDLGYV